MMNIKTCSIHYSELPCRECVLDQHRGPRTGRHKLKGDPREPEPFYVPKLSRKATHAERVEFLERLAKDPARLAGLQAMLRKPTGVSKTRHALAIHRREPMLNARPETIKSGLSYKDEGSPKLRKGDRRGRLIVKANSLQASRYGGRAGFWGERLWTVYSTEYGRGFFIQTDEGHHTASFPTIGELKSAITQSGWRIVRSLNV